ncbi:MAG: magnetosome protein MamI [Thermodesulfobacteriota bacterium]
MGNIILGVVALAFGVWGLGVWWWSVVEVVRGLVPVAAVVFGLVAVGAGIAGLRKGASQDEADEDEEELEAAEPATGASKADPF